VIDDPDELDPTELPSTAAAPEATADHDRIGPPPQISDPRVCQYGL